MKSAVVIGGGIAGLASAKVLSRHYDQVTLFDGGPQPQAQHLHVLLQKGQELLEGIFPGILRKLTLAGSPTIDWAQDTVWENSRGAFPRYNSSVKALSMSRTLLQELMRVDIRQSGISIMNQRAERPYPASDLVVLAMGQNISQSEMFREEDSLPVNLTYRSYVFRQRDLNLPGCKQYYYQVDPPYSLVGGVICPIEEGKVMVTMIEHEESFSVVRSLEEFLLRATPTFRRIIGDARPLTEMAVFRKATSHRRKLDLAKIPATTLVLGDTLTSLNPVFGQGMTLALMQAELLNRHRDKGSFQRASERLSAKAYMLSKAGSQEKGFAKALLRGYLSLCQHSPSLHHHFLKKLHAP
jgi:2-polyprenyl-6-methoxyphenol hydroxylase-like FAD-dependent oxidoreductase